MSVECYTTCMEIVSQDTDKYLLRADKGEEIFGVLTKWCAEQGIETAHFTAIGAINQVELAVYHLEQKEYESRNYAELLEIASCTGNIALVNSKPFIHAHGVFSTLKDIYAGHINSMIVGVTCEIFLTKMTTPANRKLNEDIGLKLLCPLNSETYKQAPPLMKGR